jgi:DNA-binding SARP family transcriptional activator/tetratricopeptide (TPR) repeat protein
VGIGPAEAATAGAAPPAVQVFALGGFRVLVHGREVEPHAWRRRSARQLFKCLLSCANRRMTRDEVIELFWPDSDPAASASNLRSTLFAMRRVLEPGSAAVGVVFSDRDTIWLRPDVELWVDADEFDSVVHASAQSSEPLQVLERASALYAGHYLPDDLFEDWATVRRDHLRRSWTELQHRLASELEQRGDVGAAALALLQVLQVDPCDERAARDAMLVLARHGQRAEALRVYQRLVGALDEELGIGPSTETVQLSRQISAGEVAQRDQAFFRCAYPFPTPTALIGRDAELTALERILTSGRSGGRAAIVGAPAGTGKSALVGQLVATAQSQGVLCLAGGCYEEHGAVPLGPFHDALVDYLLAQPADQVRTDIASGIDDLAQVIPELRYHLQLAEPATPAPRIDRMRALGAVHAYLRTLAERGPVLLCLEDLHAADETSLQLFHYLARQTRRLPLVLVATYRSDEAPVDQVLAQTLAAMRRERLLEPMSLEPLRPRETTELLRILLHGSPAESLSEAFFTATGGNPLFVEQLVFALSEAGHLQQHAGRWHGAVQTDASPGIIREVISERLRRLAPSCRETLAIAAVLGQSFEYPVLLANVAETDERALLVDLDQAISAHVIRETPSGYSFGHAFLRDAVYWTLSSPRRMLLHARAGEVLETLHGPHADSYAAELAHHFTLGGLSSEVRQKALHYSLVAGKHAAELASNSQALEHFRHAWDLLGTDASQSDPSLVWQILEGRGMAEAQVAQYTESVESYRRALMVATDPLQRARARGVIAFSLGHTGDFRQLVDECEAGLKDLAGVPGPEATTFRLHLQHLIAAAWSNRGRYAEVLRLGRRMETEAATALPGGRALTHLVIGWAYAGQGQVTRAITHSNLAVTAAEERGDRIMLATVYENLGRQEYLAGHLTDAREHIDRALSIFSDAANELRAVNATHTLCRILIAEGDYERAREHVADVIDLELNARERWAADAFQIMGSIHVARGQWSEARQCFEAALALRKQPGHLAGTVEALVALGQLEQYTEHLDDAHRVFAEAMRVADDMDQCPQTVMVLRAKGILELRNDELSAARSTLELAMSAAGDMPDTVEYAPTLNAYAELHLREHDIVEARRLAEEALAQAHYCEHAFEAHLNLSEIALASARDAEAREHANAAFALARRSGSTRWAALIDRRVNHVTQIGLEEAQRG